VSGHKGLAKWFKQDWVDIGSKKKGGGFAKCGRSKQKKDAKRKYPKCVPRAKAMSMTESQRRSAVSRKRSKAQGVGGKPTNVRTFAKRKKVPLTKKGRKIMKSMKKTYGKDAKAVFYASKNKGVIKGVEKKKRSTKGNRKKTKR